MIIFKSLAWGMEATVMPDPEIWDMEAGFDGESSERGLKGQENIEEEEAVSQCLNLSMLL